ncbi:hypothetical protein [Cellvibrio japonicus]|nr:hypothetical protein [Cellvibrio japonicus]QEI14239.1 hypothetical protein FY117_13285 [Cellvibrio japonicus]QEI17816.1 hypothetical protein FY116_13290 [Cellvibrio japonicus]QEI21391.1 hypothetical protein FY115_13285 [Cellvibrio japonicus]
MNARLRLPILTVLTALTLLLLSGCAHRQFSDDNWPSNMPPRAYFVKTYEADEANRAIQSEQEYLTWILRFYQGWELYKRGWVKMTDELLTQVDDPSQAKEVKYKVERIGRLVSGEWAKKSNTRTIYLRHVSVWGNALLESLDRDEALPLINRINQDVDDLLAHRISKDVITADRYYPQDPDNPFL